MTTELADACTSRTVVVGRVLLPRIVTAEDLRARLGRELDALRESEEALYVFKRGRLSGVLLDADR